MGNFLVPEDRLDQKLTLVCRDGRSIERDLNLWLLTWLAGIDYVCQIHHAHFVPHSVLNFGGKSIPPWNTKTALT
jgi:hypothetical protein